jgi:hypothetical protein
MAAGSLVSIEPDERGFWHVNFWEVHHPDLEGTACDAFKTTKVGAPLEDAITLAKSFKPTRIAVWEPCEMCGGSGVSGDIEIDWEDCDECEDGMVCRYLEDLQKD